MNKGTVLVLLLVVLGGGYGLGRLATRDKGGSSDGAAAATTGGSAAGDGVDRFRVPLEGPAKGPANAKVNIVAFSDFQCPFCSRVMPTLDADREGLRQRGADRLPPQPAPLPRRRAARRPRRPSRPTRRGSSGRCTTSCSPTSRTSSAPTWRSTPRSSASTWASSRPRSTRTRGKKRIEADMALAKQIGVQGTPNFFINGRNVRGAQPYRGVQEGHRRGDRARRQADRAGDAGRPGLRRRS